MRRPTPTPPATLAAAALLPGAALLFHLRLLRADPAADAVLPQPPAALRLWFSQPAEVAVTRVRLVGPRGPVPLGPLQPGTGTAAGAPPRAASGRDAAVVAAVRGPMPPGAYAVEWRTMAADGHPVAGRTSFRVAAPAAPAGRAR